MKTTTPLFRPRLLTTASTLPLFLLLTGCPPAQPPAPGNVFDLNSRLVFPHTNQAITLDGQAAEAAWADGFDYELEQGSTKPDGTLRGVATESDFYVSAKFNGDTSYDGYDSVVFLINPSGANNNYHRIIIQPCGTSGAGCPGDAPGTGLTPAIQYQTGTLSGSTVNWTGPVQNGPPPGIDIKSANIPGGTNNSWSIEMKIAKSSLGGFTDNWMGMLVNGVVADMNTETGVVYSWPENAYITGEIDAPGGTGYPDVAKWGEATLSKGFGNGVSVAAYEFGSNQANPSQIALDKPNSFYAWAINNTSTAGTLVPAADVKATFTIANFGLSNAWANVPGNPAGAVTIPAAGAHRYETALWNLSAAEVTNYTNNPHQCIRVTLTSTNPGTVIVQPSVQKNMDFVTVNSPFESKATLDARSFGQWMATDKPYFRLREEFLNLEPEMDWQTRLAGAEQRGKDTWLVPAGGDSGKLGVWVNPSDKLQLPSTRVPLKPGTGGPGTRPMVAKVEAGSLVTLLVDGDLKLGPIAVSGGGISLEQARGAKIDLGRGELPQNAPDRIGAVLGSFDNFATSFVVGNGVTLRVPAGASVLSLKINDTEKGYTMQGGDGFSVQVVPGKMFPWMTYAFPQLATDGRSKGPTMLPLGASLPSWIAHGYYPTNDYIVINKKRLKIERPAGSFGYSIRDVGVKRGLGTIGTFNPATTVIR
jgi:hypothetical protein